MQNIIKKTGDETVSFVIKLSKALLESGAETYRVEESVERILSAKGYEEVNVFAIPTGVFISSVFSGEKGTIYQKSMPSDIDLEKIIKLNDISRRFAAGEYDIEQAYVELESVNDVPRFNFFIKWLGACMGGGFFVVLFGANLYEFILSFFASGFTFISFGVLSKYKVNFFIKNIIGGFIAGLMGFISILLVYELGIDANMNLVIIGPLMTLVPGVALTNGMRDLISGDTIAGSTKILETLFISLGLAFGVGALLKIIVEFL